MDVLLGGLLHEMSKEDEDLQRQVHARTETFVVSLLQKNDGDSCVESSAVGGHGLSLVFVEPKVV